MLSAGSGGDEEKSRMVKIVELLLVRSDNVTTASDLPAVASVTVPSADDDTSNTAK